MSENKLIGLAAAFREAVAKEEAQRKASHAATEQEAASAQALESQRIAQAHF